MHSCGNTVFADKFHSLITYRGHCLVSLPVFVRTHLQIDGPYNEAFLEKLQKCPAEDDGSVEYAVAKVSLVPDIPHYWGHIENWNSHHILCVMEHFKGWVGFCFFRSGVRG